MAFNFDNIVSGAKDIFDKAAAKAGDAIDYSKTQIDRGQLKMKIKEKYCELGKICYDMHECGDDKTGEMVSFGQKKLLERGYLPYYLYRQKNTPGNLENTGFAKAGRECLYNIYIMEETQTILAAGAGGSTKLVDNSTGRIERLFNYKYPYEYVSRYGKMSEKKKLIKEFFDGTGR